MRALAAVLLLATVALAGCNDAPPSVEQELSFTINNRGDAFAVGVPFVLHEGGPTPEEWLAGTVIHSANANLSLRQIDGGHLLWIEGNARAVTINVNDLWGTFDLTASSARFSNEPAANGLPLMILEIGDLDLTWSYEATSKNCFLAGNYWWMAPEPGVHMAGDGGRISASPDCPA